MVPILDHDDEEEDEFDEMTDIRGGFDIPLPANVPGVEADEADVEADGDDAAVADEAA